MGTEVGKSWKCGPAQRSAGAAEDMESRFRTMADTAPVLLWMAGRDALCDFFNQGWLSFTGRTLEQEYGNGWAEGVHPEDFARCMQTYMDAFVERRPFIGGLRTNPANLLVGHRACGIHGRPASGQRGRLRDNTARRGAGRDECGERDGAQCSTGVRDQLFIVAQPSFRARK